MHESRSHSGFDSDVNGGQHAGSHVCMTTDTYISILERYLHLDLRQPGTLSYCRRRLMKAGASHLHLASLVFLFMSLIHR